MKIGELSERSGVSVRNLRFYQRKGVLSGGRDFDEDTLLMVKEVRLLRSMGIPLEEVCKVVWRQETLYSVLLHQHFDLRKGTPEWVKSTAEALMEQKAAFRAFDPDPYLTDAPGMPREGRLPYANCPWRRFFARTVDFSIYRTVVAVLFFVFRIWRGPWYISLLDILLSALLMLLMEPLWLHFAGTTPGKALFGLKLRRADGGKLGYCEALRRTGTVILRGEGLYIPIYALYRNIRCGFACNGGSRMEWDYDSGSEPYDYTAPETTAVLRGIGYVGCRAAFFGVIMLSVMAELVPLHTGEVHLAEFTENFNYYSRFSVYPDGEVLNQLDAQGNWEKVPRPEGEAVAYVNLNGNAEDQFPAPFQYTLEDGRVIGVSFTDAGDGLLYTGLNQGKIQWMVLSLSADWNPVDNVMMLLQLEDAFAEHLAETYTFTVGNCTVRWEVSMEGFDETSIGYLSDGENGSYVQTVTVTKR